jgi:hypothetical protein
MTYAIRSMSSVAQEVAGALVRLAVRDGDIARLSTPLLYSGGAMVG